MIKWHRLLALLLEDLFTGSGYRVEVEIDLSKKQQFLDAVIIEHDSNLPPPSTLPDGLDNLAAHNLITYKSFREPLDAWVLYELIGHYCNYRKQLAEPGSKKLQPEEDFRLYAVAARYPQKLAGQTTVKPVRTGVYQVEWGPLPIRVVVPAKMPNTDWNAAWAMLSGNRERVFWGENHYRWHDPEKAPIFINRLHETYLKEGIDMPYTLDDFLRHDREDWLQSLPPEERLKGLPPEERLKGLSPEQRLKLLPPELLKALPEETVKAWLAHQEAETKH